MTDLSPTVDATVTCPTCGSQNLQAAVRCRDCGASLLATAGDVAPDEERGDLELEEEWRAAGVAGFDTDLPLEADDRGVCAVCGAVVALTGVPWSGSRAVRDTPSGRNDLVVVLVRCPTCATPLRAVIEADALPDDWRGEPSASASRSTDGVEAHHAAPAGATADRPLGTDREFFESAGPGSLRDRESLLDAEGEDIRQYTGEPVETEEGRVLPQQQNVGIGNAAGGGEWPDPNAFPAQGSGEQRGAREQPEENRGTDA